jgi:hypothetical protein
MKKCSTTEETYTVIEKKGQSINIERESDMQENINLLFSSVDEISDRKSSQDEIE